MKTLLKEIISKLINWNLLRGDVDVFKDWADGLSHLDEISLRHGLRKARDRNNEYQIKIGEFLEMCTITAEDLNLPDARRAYIEACNKPSPKEKQKWSHPIVYHAGRSCGWFELRHTPEKDMFPVFRNNYDDLLKRFLAGESLEIELPKAIPDKIESPLKDKDKKFADLKASL